MFFRVQAFLGPGFSGSRFFRVWVEGPGPGFRSSLTRTGWYTREDNGMNDQMIIYGQIRLVHYTMNTLSHRHGYRKVLPVLLKYYYFNGIEFSQRLNFQFSPPAKFYHFTGIRFREWAHFNFFLNFSVFDKEETFRKKTKAF